MHEHTNHDSVRHRGSAVKDCEYFLASKLRIHYGPGYRIYFQRRGNLIVVLLCGGDKSTQTHDMAAARKLANEWREQDD